jgi:hypothetical protein
MCALNLPASSVVLKPKLKVYLSANWTRGIEQTKASSPRDGVFGTLIASQIPWSKQFWTASRSPLALGQRL